MFVRGEKNIKYHADLHRLSRGCVDSVLTSTALILGSLVFSLLGVDIKLWLVREIED